MKTLLRAAWIAPMDGPPLPDGGVVLEARHGRILQVGSAAELRRAHPDAHAIDAGNAVILPGLINAHTHLELSDQSAGSCPAGGFTEWILALAGRRRRLGDRLRDAVTNATATGAAQCLRFGVTCVGDISPHCAWSRAALQSSPLRAVSYGEVIAAAGLRQRLPEMLAAAIDGACATERLHIGITPHAPYTVEPEGYRQCLSAARDRSLPLATHLAENAEEAAFLESHTGPFRDVWDVLGLWDDAFPRFAGGPIRLAESVGLLDYPTVLAHVNYCDDDELAILARGRAGVVYCPRTHAYFGHPPHRWREMLAVGINVAIGTDSCASSPDLNLVDDLRLLHRLAPDVPPLDLWRMATIRPARALGLDRSLGTLTAGKQADLAVFPTATSDPLREILEIPGRLPELVWTGGRRAR